VTLGIVIMKHHSHSSEVNCLLAHVWCESIQCTAASFICQVAHRAALTLWRRNYFFFSFSTPCI